MEVVVPLRDTTVFVTMRGPLAQRRGANLPKSRFDCRVDCQDRIRWATGPSPETNRVRFRELSREQDHAFPGLRPGRSLALPMQNQKGEIPEVGKIMRSGQRGSIAREPVMEQLNLAGN